MVILSKFEENVQMNVKGRWAVFFALLFFSFSLAFAISSLLTDFWIHSDNMLRNGTLSANNKMNSGLFFGVRQLDWAFGPKKKEFSVFNEIQSGVSFFDRHFWFMILLSSGLGLLCNLSGIFVAIRNATFEDHLNKRTALGPRGVCLWAFLTAISYGFSLLFFYYQFQTQIQNNVLLPEEIVGGFSSHNCQSLGFSFFLMLGAFSCQIIPMPFLYCTLHFGQKRGKKADKENYEVQKDDTVFIY